jgi:hypothetical protein
VGHYGRMTTEASRSSDRSFRLSPGERAAGHRGVRGRLAAVVAMLSLVALSTHAWHGSGGGAAGALSYSYDGWRGWTTPVFLAVAAALLVAAAALWTARTWRGVALGAVIAGVAIAIGAWAAVIGQQFALLSRADFRGAKLGMSESLLEGHLGAPFTTDASTTLSPSGVTAGCVLYRASGSTGQGAYAFCFRDGRLAQKVEVPL